MSIRLWVYTYAHVIILAPFYLLNIGNGEKLYGEQLFGTFHLREYSTFGDVTLFHVVIPPHCESARWNIGILIQDTRCPRTEVNIAIQPWSLPLDNPLNTSYPPHTVTAGRRDMTPVTMMSDRPISVTFVSPVQGDWFMTSSLPKSDSSKIEQQGLGGITCRYYIQMAVSYWQERDVQALGSQTRTQVELSQEKNQTSAVYRFYVPPLSKSVTFSYRDCKVTLAANGTAGGDPCPVAFRIRSSGLPSSLRTPPIACEADTSCTFLVAEPRGSRWYYVRLDLFPATERATVELSLGVEVQECAEESVIQYSVVVDQDEIDSLDFVQNVSLASPQLTFYNDTLASGPSPGSRLLDSFFMVPPVSDVRPAPRAPLTPQVPPGWCPPVLLMSSAQLGGANPYKTFILGSANGTGEVEVPPASPVVLQLELDILQDVGGNLIIDGYIGEETEGGLDDQTYITLCLQSGAIPPLNGTRISCDPFYSVAFSSANVSTALPWILPFPAPGVWYLSLESSCKSTTGMVPCNQTTTVSLDVSLYACVDNCGDYGSCHSTTDMGILFYYCKCSRGYRGWGCTDDAEAWSQAYFLSRVLLLTLSNVFFIFPCLLALKRHHFVPAIAFFCTLVFSSFYHSCDSGSLCIMSFDTLQFCDFYSAFMSIFLTLVTMARLPIPMKNSLEILGAFGMALGTSYNRFSLWAVAVPVGVGLAVMLASWSRRCYKRRHCYPTTKWRWLFFIVPGTAVIVTGLCLFAFLETSDNYQYIHSAWHVAMAIGVTFLLPPRESNDKQHYDHMSELVDINTLNSELVVNDDPGY